METTHKTIHAKAYINEVGIERAHNFAIDMIDELSECNNKAQVLLAELIDAIDEYKVFVLNTSEAELNKYNLELFTIFDDIKKKYKEA